MKRSLIVLACLGLAACSRAGVVEITNDTSCSFNDIKGFRTDPKTGERSVVFHLYTIAAGDTRPGFFDETWDGVFFLYSERTEFYTDQVEIRKGTERFSLSMPRGASAACLTGDQE